MLSHAERSATEGNVMYKVYEKQMQKNIKQLCDNETTTSTGVNGTAEVILKVNTFFITTIFVLMPRFSSLKLLVQKFQEVGETVGNGSHKVYSFLNTEITEHELIDVLNRLKDNNSKNEEMWKLVRTFSANFETRSRSKVDENVQMEF